MRFRKNSLSENKAEDISLLDEKLKAESMKVACEEKVERKAEDDDKCMSFTQKCIAYCFGFVDVLLHTMLIFGWSALTALYKKENYYRDACVADEDVCASQNAKISQIMVYSASFAGIIIFGLGVIRDYLGPGLSLIATKLTLALGYLLMWQAVPGESDNLLYGWVFQYGSAVTLMIGILPNSRLFEWSLFLITVNTLGANLSQFMGQVWELVCDNTDLTSRDLSLIWACLILFSIVTGALFLPWYTVTTETRAGRTFLSVFRSGDSWIEKTGTSPVQNFKTTLACLASPVYISSVFLFSVGNFISHMSLSLINDFIYDRKEVIEDSGSTYEDYLSYFNITKTVINTAASPVLGFAMQYLRDKYNKEKYDERLIQLVWPYILFMLSLVLMAVGVFQSSVGSLWLVFISLSFVMRIGYFYELFSVEICFPYSTMGIAFAVIEIVGGLINFAEEPIIERKRTSGELDWFNYTIVAGACVAILPTFLQLPLTFKRSTSCHRALDETRQEMLKAQNTAVTAGKEEKILSAKGNFEHDSNLE